MKTDVVIVLAAMLALIASSVGAVGCNPVEDAFNCANVCSRYQECFDGNYDVGGCEQRCQDRAEREANMRAIADACAVCIDDNLCYSMTLGCPACAGIVP